MQIESTFFQNSLGYTSTFKRGELCPPYVVASVARDRIVQGASLEMPQDYTAEVLNSIAWLTGYVDQPTQIGGRQALELRHIGQQLLALDANGQIQPPLNLIEMKSVEHLLRLVPTES